MKTNYKSGYVTGDGENLGTMV